VKLCNTFRMLCRADKPSVLGNSPVRKPSGCSTTMRHFPMSYETLIRRSVYSWHTLTLRYMRIGANSCLLILLLWDPKIFVGIREKNNVASEPIEFFHTHTIPLAFLSLLQDGPSGSILVWNRSERIRFIHI